MSSLATQTSSLWNDFNYDGIRLGSFLIRNRYLAITSTAYRALEVAVVTNPNMVDGTLYERGNRYSVLRTSWHPMMGLYIGPVGTGGRTTYYVVVLPYWLLFLVAMTPRSHFNIEVGAVIGTAKFKLLMPHE